MLDIQHPNLKWDFMSLKILLQDQIDRLFDDNPELKKIKKDHFEIAVAHFINLKYLNGQESDDLIDGIAGTGGDEGIDLCYVFCNGNLVKSDEQPINSDSILKVKFFQVKKEDSFTVEAMRKLKEGIEEIFNLDLSLKELKVIGANEDILEKAELIRTLFRKSQLQRASFMCEVYYITAAPEIRLPEKIKTFKEALSKNSLGIPFKFDFLGAQALIDLNKKFDEKLEITFESQPLDISERDIATKGFAGFVKGNILMEALTDDDNNFRSHLTEGNIRFFLGEDKKINSSIIDSALDIQKANIFWAMNNGITILGDSILPIEQKVYSISNPQIVNGCQTIHCLNAAYTKGNKNSLPSSLKVFVKLVNTDNINTQTDIISATNSQNTVKSASLKANDDIQKNIEIHLKTYGIFYERRENYYKRQGYKGNKVIGLLKMAQIIHTIVNHESIVATNDTATLFDTVAKYNLLFDDKADFDLYVFGTKLYQKIWTLKNSDIRNNEYSKDERDLISKGGFVLLNIISTLMFSEAEFKINGKKHVADFTGNLIIKQPAKKNDFTIRKESLFKNLQDDDYLTDIYNKSKKIFYKAADSYEKTSGKTKISLFKNRTFDKEFIKPVISSLFYKLKKKLRD